MVTVFLADGFEEIEAVTPIDILRRGGVEVRTCSITESKTVVGAHGIPFVADAVLAELSDAEDVILLPGGMPGTVHLKECGALCTRIRQHAARGGILAAICAAPTVFGELGLLKNERATCYPGMEEYLKGAVVEGGPVSVDGNIITGVGVGGAIAFALEIVKYLFDEETAKELKESIVDKF